MAGGSCHSKEYKPGWLLVSLVTFPLTLSLWRRFLFNFWESGDWKGFLMLHPSISHRSLSSFCLGPSVLSANSCLSPWHGTFHQLENHRACFPQPFPLWISAVGLPALLPALGGILIADGFQNHYLLKSTLVSTNEYLSRNSSVVLERQYVQCSRTGMLEADCWVWILTPFPSSVNLNKLLKFSST